MSSNDSLCDVTVIINHFNRPTSLNPDSQCPIVLGEQLASINGECFPYRLRFQVVGQPEEAQRHQIQSSFSST